MLKEHSSKLFRGIDIEFLPRQLKNLRFQLFNLDTKLLSIGFQLSRLHFHTCLLHIKQGKDKRHLNFIKKRLHTALLQFLPEDGRSLVHGVRLITTLLLLREFPVNRQIQIFSGDIIRLIRAFQRI